MTIWKISDPKNHLYACASLRGSWSKGENSERIRPLIIEWEQGSDVIGDFVWPGFGGDLIVKQSVGEKLSRNFEGFELSEIKMIHDGRTKKKPRLVSLPFEGPQLVEIWTTAWVGLDLAMSTVTKVDRDGSLGYTVSGIEKLVAKWDPATRERKAFRVPRESGAGIFVSNKEFRGASIFKVVEFPGWIFCSSHVKDFIIQENYSNIDFFEVGTIC